MFKSYKYRIYPTEQQESLINRHIGVSRLIYNLALETKKTAWYGYGKNLSTFDLYCQITDLKKGFSFLNSVSLITLRKPILNLNKAYLNFYNGINDYPVFKKKTSYGSFSTDHKDIKIKNNRISLPKFKGGIKISLHRPLFGKILEATVSKTSTNKYYISLSCEIETHCVEKELRINNCIGVDLGIKTFAVTSDGQVFENPKFLRKAQSRLKYINRKYSKYKGKRTKLKLALVHEKVANKRRDFLHKTSSKLISDNQTICIEDLAICNMVKNNKLSLSIVDASWAELARQLEYKSEWYGKNILKIGRFEPSSKTCSNCGSINKDLTLKDREWTCICGVTHDRDINAAINIKNFAFKKLVSGIDTKNRNELPEILGVTTYEAHLA